VTPRTQKEKISVAIFSPNEMRRPGHDPEKCEAAFRKIMPEQGGGAACSLCGICGAAESLR
jgi:hypothetical protein